MHTVCLTVQVKVLLVRVGWARFDSRNRLLYLTVMLVDNLRVVVVKLDSFC